MIPLVEIANLRKVYHSAAVSCEALKGLSFDMGDGEYVAVMGHSGSGKSTLLHLVGGLDQPTGGAVRVKDHVLNEMTETELARFRRGHIGFVFQFFHLVDNLTVRANVELPALLNGYRDRAKAHERAEALLAELGIVEHADKYPWELSGGQQQRVAIARSLINRPDLLLVDEPTGNLDSGSSQAVLQILRDCNAGGQAILMVTHDPRAAAEAERVLFLYDGRLVNDVPGGDPQRVARRLTSLL